MKKDRSVLLALVFLIVSLVAHCTFIITHSINADADTFLLVSLILIPVFTLAAIVFLILALIVKDETPAYEAVAETVAPAPIVEPEPEPVVHEVEIPIFEHVEADEVDDLLEDEVALSMIEESDYYADRTKQGIINVDVISNYFEPHDTVTLDELKNRIPGFDKKMTFVKILANGTLDKPLTVYADSFSVEAAKMILLTGGTVIKSKRK